MIVHGLDFADNLNIGISLAIVSHGDISDGDIDALQVEMEDPEDENEYLRFVSAGNSWTLNTEEELLLAYYLAARNPDEVRRFLDRLGGEVIDAD